MTTGTDPLADLSQTLRDAQELNAAAGAALTRAATACETALEQPLNTAGNAPLLPPCEHRRLHRPGRPGKIASDPELQAFIRARADRLTYDQIAAAIREHFPPDRHVSRSTVHKWWSAQLDPPKSHSE